MSRFAFVVATTLLVPAVTWTDWSAAQAQLTRVRPTDQAAQRSVWFDQLEGWQIGVWGAPGAHRWAVDRRGRGMISLPGPARTGGRRAVEQRFVLSPAELSRFAALIRQFTAAPQNDDLCMTDQAQDVVRWHGGSRGNGLYNFDHGCRDAANMAQLDQLTQALAILRTAAARTR